jgi:Arc/MetJ-type ribon-helix-helix transcriptional regulator
MIKFDDDLEAFVRVEVESGHFSSRDDLLSHAVRLLRRDRQEAIFGIEAGLNDVAEGRVEPLAEAFAAIRSGSLA